MLLKKFYVLDSVKCFTIFQATKLSQKILEFSLVIFGYNWKFIVFQDGTLRVPFSFLLLFCSHPFFGLNAFLISGIKPLLRTMVRKYAEGKGPVADSVRGLTTWCRGLQLLLTSWLDRERTCPRLWLKLTNFSTLNFNLEKLNSFFLLRNSHWERLLAMKALDVIIQLRKVEFLFLLHGRRESGRT